MFFAPAIRNESKVPGLGLLDGAFERFMTDAFTGFRSPWHMQEDEKSWTVSLDLPGVAKEHLSVSLEGKTVRVETSGEAKRQFKAAYEMPHEIDPEGCEAKLENGVLTLKLAKVEKQSTGRQITVN